MGRGSSKAGKVGARRNATVNRPTLVDDLGAERSDFNRRQLSRDDAWKVQRNQDGTYDYDNIIFYRGTNTEDAQALRDGSFTSATGRVGNGIYLTPFKSYARDYAKDNSRGEGQKGEVLAVKLKTGTKIVRDNDLIGEQFWNSPQYVNRDTLYKTSNGRFTYNTTNIALAEYAKSLGYDGIVSFDHGLEVSVFNSRSLIIKNNKKRK